MSQENIPQEQPASAPVAESPAVASATESPATESPVAESPVTESAATKSPATKSPVGPAQEKKGNVYILELGAAVIVLVALALIICNCALIYLAEDYNSRVCKTAWIEAWQAIGAGKDPNAVASAAQMGRMSGGMGGFFIQTPDFTYYKDDCKKGERTVTVQTTTFVRLPAPVLVPDKDAQEQGKVYVTCTYSIEIGGNTGNWIDPNAPKPAPEQFAPGDAM